MAHPLEACLQFSRDMVKARMRGNHKPIKSTFRQDSKMIELAGLGLEIQNLKLKIKRNDKE